MFPGLAILYTASQNIVRLVGHFRLISRLGYWPVSYFDLEMRLSFFPVSWTVLFASEASLD